MNTHVSPAPVRQSVVVEAPIEHAFKVFTEQFGSFKPKEHNLLAVPIAETVFDSFAPQLDLSFAAAVYGLVGLFLGSLIGELLATLVPRHHLVR